MAFYNSTSTTSGCHYHFLAKKKLFCAETRYSAFDRELLAVFVTIRHLRHNIEGRNFFVNTDHKPLTYVMTSVTERPSLRQTRHLAFIAEFTTYIRYVKGKQISSRRFTHKLGCVHTLSLNRGVMWDQRLTPLRDRSGLRMLTSSYCLGGLALTSFAANRSRTTYTTGTELDGTRAAWRKVVAFCLCFCAQYYV